MAAEHPSTHTVRPPIIAVLGHVDHGKSTLLDFIRKSNTVAKEAGGITQHVAAYEVEREREGKTKRITFIDTPGHAAFQAIRARGASVADIAILVVAADDGVKPQTLEALQSIRAAETPFIVAINKIDKQNASVERTQASLAENGVYLEKLGGDIPWVAISAKAGTGVDELLDLILLVAEVEELKGDAEKPASGYVIEAHRDQKRGLAATLILTDGTLESGMCVLAGRALAPVRIMEDYKGKNLRGASFSTPVTLVGFDELPEAGAEFRSYPSKKEAEAARPAPIAAHASETNASSSETFLLPVIIRADAAGSLEAIAHELSQVGDEHARVQVVQTGLGSVTEGDVKAAVAGAIPAVVVGFGVGIDHTAEILAHQHGVKIYTYDIIYKLTEGLDEALRTTRPTRTVEEVVGRIRILKLFSSRKDEYVVGGSLSEGYVAKKSNARVSRRKEILGTGKVTNLQANKQNVDRIDAPAEFGAQIEAPFEIAQGDILEIITEKTE